MRRRRRRRAQRFGALLSDAHPPSIPIPCHRYEVLEAMAAYDESAEAAAEALEGWRYDGHEYIGARVRRSYEKTKAISVRWDASRTARLVRTAP